MGEELLPAPHDFVFPISDEGDLGCGVGASFGDSGTGDGAGGGPIGAKFGDLDVGSPGVVGDGFLIVVANLPRGEFPICEVCALGFFE